MSVNKTLKGMLILSNCITRLEYAIRTDKGMEIFVACMQCYQLMDMTAYHKHKRNFDLCADKADEVFNMLDQWSEKCP